MNEIRPHEAMEHIKLIVDGLDRLTTLIKSSPVKILGISTTGICERDDFWQVQLSSHTSGVHDMLALYGASIEDFEVQEGVRKKLSLNVEGVEVISLLKQEG